MTDPPGQCRRRGPRSHRFHTAASSSVVLAGALGYVGLVDPHNAHSVYPLCPFKWLTGWNCPLCGDVYKRQFLDDPGVRLVGYEAAGDGVETGRHAATFAGGSPGAFQGSFSYLLQDLSLIHI